MAKSKEVKSPANNFPEESLSPKSMVVNYLKTPNYRTYHVDGIYGGLTAQKKIYVELFIQRSVTPQQAEHKIKPDGTPGDEIERQGKPGIIREIESGLIMDIEVAEVFRDWLEEKINALKNIKASIKKQEMDGKVSG